MGWGDDIIFLGKAKEVHEKTGKKIVPVYGPNGNLSPMFELVEFLSAKKDKNSITVNSRDTDQISDVHIDYWVAGKEKTPLGERLISRDFTPSRFALPLSQREEEKAEEILDILKLNEFCIINPDYKSKFFSENKNWGFYKYQELTNRLSGNINIVRIKPKDNSYNEPNLENAINLNLMDYLDETYSEIRICLAILKRSKFGVTFDGLMHHVLSGYNIPCVVIHGGLISKSSLAYSGNKYHQYDHPLTPCGSMYKCAHCKEANDSITVDEVFESCMNVLNESFSNPS